MTILAQLERPSALGELCRIARQIEQTEECFGPVTAMGRAARRHPELLRAADEEMNRENAENGEQTATRRPKKSRAS